MIETFLHALWQILLDLAPYLLLGLLIAGLMHVYLPTGFIHRGLSQPTLRSAWRASLIGVPLPLCSCGVIPTALGLRNEGASKGATTAFLISTPQTGVDSILVSAAFLGWPFALFKVIAALFTGLIGGELANRLTRHQDNPFLFRVAEDEQRRGGLKRVLHYAHYELLAAIDLWIIAGVLVAAAITTLVPPDYFATQDWAQGLGGMLLVLLISVPLYVCATGSVPIAASLIAAGMPLGSALVFLMAGPATNVATIGAIYRTLGAKVLTIYLGTVIGMSLLFGMSFDYLLQANPNTDLSGHAQNHWIYQASAWLLIILLLHLGWRRLRARLQAREAPPPGALALRIGGMTCQHCAATVHDVLQQAPGVSRVTVDLAKGQAVVEGTSLQPAPLIEAVKKAGYEAGIENSGP